MRTEAIGKQLLHSQLAVPSGEQPEWVPGCREKQYDSQVTGDIHRGYSGTI